MDELTPSVEPLSLDEAFIDLSGTQKLGAIPAVMLETDQRISMSWTDWLNWLSHNKFLAKIASDLDKPRDFLCIGWNDTKGFQRQTCKPHLGCW